MNSLNTKYFLKVHLLNKCWVNISLSSIKPYGNTANYCRDLKLLLYGTPCATKRLFKCCVTRPTLIGPYVKCFQNGNILAYNIKSAILGHQRTKFS